MSNLSKSVRLLFIGLKWFFLISLYLVSYAILIPQMLDSESDILCFGGILFGFVLALIVIIYLIHKFAEFMNK